MSGSVPTWVAYISGVPGIAALLGAAAGYGRTMQRLQTVENKMTKVDELTTNVAKIEVQTNATAESVKGIKEDVNLLTNHLLGERRSFEEPKPRRR